VTSDTPSSERPYRRLAANRISVPRLFTAVPPRVFGHALVVVMCLAVAYAGRTNRLADQLGLLSPQTEAPSQPSLTVGMVGQASDALVSPPLADTQTASNQRMDITHYEAQVGDTVAALADRFDISENTIIWTNNLSADGQIEPGQQLVILPISGVLYTVQPGDTLLDIANRFQSDDQAIVQVNQLIDPVHVVPGTQLIVPGGRLDTASRAGLSSRSSARPVAGPAGTVPTSLPPPAVAPMVEAKPTTVVDNFVEQVTHLPFAQRSQPAQPVAPTLLAPVDYIVASGDTLSTIADKFGVSQDSIAAASGIQGNSDALSINQKLLIPPVPGVLHVVQDGDTLLAVAERYGADSAEIVKANGLTDPFLLQIGYTLVVPGGKIASPAVVAVPTAVPAPTPTTYTVQAGDSLLTIATSFGVDLRGLADANGISNPDSLQLGEQIVINGPSRPAPAPAPAPRAADAAQPAQVAVQTAPVETQPAPVVRVVARPAPVVVAAVAKPAPAPVSNGGGWGIVATASRYLGAAYVWGGTSPGGFDCSGFVWYVFRKAGVPIPRDMWGQYQSGSRVSRANLQAGDIVFFAGTDGAGLSHDGIYLGGGRFIDAADYGIGVTVSSLGSAYYSAHYYGAVRPW
jgi:cell wall-associated NlpC family hydrolase